LGAPPRGACAGGRAAGRNLDDFQGFALGARSPLLYHYERDFVVAITSTGILSLRAMVRIDTLPEPLPNDIDEVGLRAACLARGGEAVAMIEADGSHLINPSLTLKWGEAATWPPADPSEAPLHRPAEALITTTSRDLGL
jgi:hypothetical protein